MARYQLAEVESASLGPGYASADVLFESIAKDNVQKYVSMN